MLLNSLRNYFSSIVPTFLTLISSHQHGLTGEVDKRAIPAIS